MRAKKLNGISLARAVFNSRLLLVDRLFAAVRPDRDAAGRTHAIRQRRCRATTIGDVDLDVDTSTSDEWVRKLPVDMRTLLSKSIAVFY